MYYLYSIKMGGWISRTATYTSDIADAGTFSHDEAMRRAKRTKSESAFGVIPVPIEIIEELS